MRMRLLAAGTRMPDWVDAGCDDYATHLRGDYRLELIEIPATAAAETHAGRSRPRAGACWRRRSKALPRRPAGWRQSPPRQLARWLEDRAREGIPRSSASGPDGLAPEIDAQARLRWSLSAPDAAPGLPG
jgi:23S rRNA (pseudouridine1915-N3)-methyltransferase